MSLKIKLKQIGKRDQRGFRIVINEEHSKRDGKVLEVIGFVEPGTKTVAKIDDARLTYWKSVGAQETEGVRKLLGKK